MLVHWIWLAHRPAVNDRLKAALLEHFRDPEAVFFADEKALNPVPGLTPAAREALMGKNLMPSEEILEECRGQRLGILNFQ